MLKLGSKKGFTLIELMIVVAIIGILAAIAIPQFAQMVMKSQEGATKGNLGTIRSALSIYYGDTEGFYPLALDTGLTTAQKYLKSIPNAQLPKTTNSPGHGSSNAASTQLADTSGGWYYEAAQTNTLWGGVAVNCQHQDLRGVVWSGY